MSNMTQLLEHVVERIQRGETVPVKDEYQKEVAEALKARGIRYISVPEQQVNTSPRVLFSAIQENSSPNPAD